MYQCENISISNEAPKQDRGHAEAGDLPDTETFWQNIAETTRQDILTTYNSVFERRRRRGYEETEIQETIDAMVERERSFVIAVLSRLQEAESAHKGETVILFDIDETIGTPDFLPDNRMVTLLRPSLIPLLTALSAPHRRHIGFLSSRGKETMIRQLEDPEHLASLRKYVDVSYIFSSREEQELYYVSMDELGDKLKEAFGGENGIIDERLLGKDSEFDYPSLPGDYTKLAVLKRIRHEMTGERAIVVVDDFEYPKYLDARRGMYGIPLRESGGAFFKP